MLWRTEVRKHLPVFAAVYSAIVLVGVARWVAPDVLVLEIVQALCGMLCWTGSAVYAATILFRFITLGDDVSLQISSVGRWSSASLKASVLCGLLVLQHLLGVAVTVDQLRNTAAAEFATALVYVVVAKTLSIVSFLTLVLLSATSAKVFSGRGACAAVFVIGLLTAITAQGLTLWRIGAPTTEHFFIGVGGDAFTVNLYANILPLTLTGPAEGFLPIITGTSMVLNLSAVLAFLACWALLIRFRRFNFVAI